MSQSEKRSCLVSPCLASSRWGYLSALWRVLERVRRCIKSDLLTLGESDLESHFGLLDLAEGLPSVDLKTTQLYP